MTGELRQKITLFLSKGGGGPEPEHFARIEEVTDSFGNRATGQASGEGYHRTSLTLRPGDVITFRGRSWDPEGSPLRWQLFFGARQHHLDVDGDALEYEWSVTEDDIGEQSFVTFELLSGRSYRRLSSCDDRIDLFYKVLLR